MLYTLPDGMRQVIIVLELSSIGKRAGLALNVLASQKFTVSEIGTSNDFVLVLSLLDYTPPHTSRY